MLLTMSLCYSSDQAWSSTPLNSDLYFHNWVTSRYHGAISLPAGLYSAWNTMRTVSTR